MKLQVEKLNLEFSGKEIKRLVIFSECFEKTGL